MNLPTAVVVLLMASIVTAQAADCPRKGTLGTSRILEIDAATTPRIGLKIYPQTLPLNDHE
ncbi:MAG TPA: polysaccharide deacetylase family protein, partial [Bradyrhizobium sp.]|nr:polysaccharide deacetylase family protein [Bradyrhizobium sp.]